MAKMTDVPGTQDYSSGVKKVLILGKDGQNMASVTNPLPTDAVVTVDTMNLTAEMKVDSGHDLYEATNVTRVANLQVSFDAIVGLTLAHIQSVENKTQGWVYNTKGATVTDTGITLVAANQNTGYPVIGASDEIEVIYRGTSRFDNKATEATLSSLEGKDFATETTLDSIKDSITDGTQVSNVQGVYNATEPSLSDGEKAQLQLDAKGKLYVNSGASGVSGGGLSLYVLDSGNTLNQGKIEYTSASTCTLSALSFTASANLISKLDRIDNTGKLVSTYTLADTAMTLSSNVLTVTGMTANATDTFVLYILGPERTTDIGQNAVMTLGLKNVWNQNISEQTLIEDGVLTATYTQIGSDIDVRGYPILQAGVVVSVGDSTDIKLRIVQKLADGSYIPIDGCAEITLTESKSYKFDLPAIETVAFQVKDAAAGTGTISLYYNQAWR